MRYNTGNPVEPSGSSAPEDLFDNSGNLDLSVNGQAAAWIDRRGLQRRSLRGLEQAFTASQTQQEVVFQQTLADQEFRFSKHLAASGLQYLGDYDTDGPLTITEYSQVFRKGGEIFGPKATLALPYTTSGNWASEQANFVSRGDAQLRQELGGPDGAGLVSHGDETVSDTLDRGAGQLSGLTSTNVENQVIDLHYSISRGTGFVQGEIGGLFETTIVSTTSNRTIVVADSSGFVFGQLIVYTGSNGEYYTSVIVGASGNSLTLSNDIEPEVLGSKFSNFYTEQSHPNANGYKAIADCALRMMRLKYQSAYLWQAGDFHTVLGTATVLPYLESSYANPGGSNFASVLVQCPAVNDGFVTFGVPLTAGDYIAKIWVNPNLSTTGSLGVFVSEDGGLGAISYLAVSDVRPSLIELPFRARNGGQYSVAFRHAVPGGSFAVSRIEFVRVLAANNSINKGTHVLLGDSWFALPGVFERLQQRLPNAKIINKGVGGEKASELWMRFNTDVTPHNPDFVWIMVGTNDVAANVPPATFYQNIGILSWKIKQIGASGIFFNGSVGPKAHTTLGDLLTRSRNYAIQDDYIGEYAGSFSSTLSSRFTVRETIEPGATKRVLLFPGITKKRVVLNTIYLVGTAGELTGTVSVGFCEGLNLPIIDPPPASAISFPMQASLKFNTIVNKSNTDSKFFAVDIQNTGSASMEVAGYVLASWTPTL